MTSRVATVTKGGPHGWCRRQQRPTPVPLSPAPVESPTLPLPPPRDRAELDRLLHAVASTPSGERHLIIDTVAAFSEPGVVAQLLHEDLLDLPCRDGGRHLMLLLAVIGQLRPVWRVTSEWSCRTTGRMPGPPARRHRSPSCGGVRQVDIPATRRGGTDSHTLVRIFGKWVLTHLASGSLRASSMRIGGPDGPIDRRAVEFSSNGADPRILWPVLGWATSAAYRISGPKETSGRCGVGGVGLRHRMAGRRQRVGRRARSGAHDGHRRHDGERGCPHR